MKIEFVLKLEKGVVFGSADKKQLQDFIKGKAQAIRIGKQTYDKDDVEKVFTLEWAEYMENQVEK